MVLALGLLALVLWCRGNSGIARERWWEKYRPAPAPVRRRLRSACFSRNRDPRTVSRSTPPPPAAPTIPRGSGFYSSDVLSPVILEPLRKDIWGAFWTILLSGTFNGPGTSMRYYSSDILSWVYPGTFGGRTLPTEEAYYFRGLMAPWQLCVSGDLS